MVNTNDFQKAVELINKAKRVLLTTHTRPDGDACGCITAICETLTTLGKNVKILLLSELPTWYEFLFEQKSAAERRDLARLDSPRRGRAEGGPEIFSKKTKIDSDLIIIVDTSSYNQLPELDKYLKQSDKPTLVIDHHATSDNLGDVRLIDSSAAATALIVFDLLK
ncbi:MAG: DHH family phosphoesterase, partial [Sedimentisphaerales bacterium]|nr:DHH family phosphoesterase [Sedimentisphaerales bacterium]